MKFNVGDRVQCIDMVDGVYYTVNELGTIIEVNECLELYAIAFDNFVDGHNFDDIFVMPLADNRISCPDGHGLWRRESTLQPAYVCGHKAEDLLNIFTM